MTTVAELVLLITGKAETGEALGKVKGDLSDVGDAADKSGQRMEAFEKIVKGAGVGLIAAAAGLEVLTRAQQAGTTAVDRLSTETGLTTEQLRKMVVEVSATGDSLSEMTQIMEVGARQGLRSADALKQYASFWDTVADATGLSGKALAEQGVVLAAVGIDVDNQKDSLAALGYVQTQTTVGVEGFLDVIKRKAPAIKEMGLSIDELAAVVGILESKGLTGRAAMAELQTAIDSSDGSMQSMLDTLGISAELFAEYEARVKASGGAIETLAAANNAAFTPLQKMKHALDELIFAHAEGIATVSSFATIISGFAPAAGLLKGAWAGMEAVMALVTGTTAAHTVATTADTVATGANAVSAGADMVQMQLLAAAAAEGALSIGAHATAAELDAVAMQAEAAAAFEAATGMGALNVAAGAAATGGFAAAAAAIGVVTLGAVAVAAAIYLAVDANDAIGQSLAKSGESWDDMQTHQSEATAGTVDTTAAILALNDAALAGHWALEGYGDAALAQVSKLQALGGAAAIVARALDKVLDLQGAAASGNMKEKVFVGGTWQTPGQFPGQYISDSGVETIYPGFTEQVTKALGGGGGGGGGVVPKAVVEAIAATTVGDFATAFAAEAARAERQAKIGSAGTAFIETFTKAMHGGFKGATEQLAVDVVKMRDELKDKLPPAQAAYIATQFMTAFNEALAHGGADSNGTLERTLREMNELMNGGALDIRTGTVMIATDVDSLAKKLGVSANEIVQNFAVLVNSGVLPILAPLKTLPDEIQQIIDDILAKLAAGVISAEEAARRITNAVAGGVRNNTIPGRRINPFGIGPMIEGPTPAILGNPAGNPNLLMDPDEYYRWWRGEAPWIGSGAGGQSGGDSGGPQVIQLTVDGRVLAEVVNRENERRY